MTLYLASNNPGKLKEFREAAAARGIAFEPVPGIRDISPCMEDGQTFEENARKKAIYYSRHVDGLVMADDSGICVDALGGGPGVYSARFAGPEATDDDNNQKLLAQLRAVPPRKSATVLLQKARTWPAHYICIIGLARRGEFVTTTEGRADGVIIEMPQGSNGFGYDPYFFFPPLGKTFAELSPDEKFRVSHRGEAFRKVLDFLMPLADGH